MRNFDLSRRHMLAASAGAAALSSMPGSLWAQSGPIMTRPIPSSGEQLPVVGIGTAIVFDFADDAAKYADRKKVLQELVAGGGKLIDTAAAYGAAEDRVGDLTAELGRDKYFIATKYASRGDSAAATASMQTSLKRLKTSKVDVMQAWNVADANYSLSVVRDFKAAGGCRYIGMTTSFDGQYDAQEQVLKREKPDFYQVDYAANNRGSEDRLLPLCKDLGIAVLINSPFGRNNLFKAVAGKPVPDWAKDIQATSWAQVFLKFILSTPGVTAVIPGTDKPEYMIDNLNAGRGPLPDKALRQKIIDVVS